MSESKEIIIIIRPSFKRFCGKDACRAALFNHLLYWIARKAKGQSVERVKKGAISWYGTAEEICEGIDRSWSVNKVRQEIKELVESKLIGQRRNPENGWDQTRHYFFGEEQGEVLREVCEKHGVCLLHLGLSPDAIHLLNLVNAIPNSGKCKCQISEMDLPDKVNPSTKSGNAIPKVSTKGTTKTSNKDDDTTIALSPEVQIFFAFWKAYRHRKSNAVINAKNSAQYERLSAKIQKQEDFDSICALAMERLPSVNDGKLWLANLISALEDWEVNKKQSQQTLEGQENDYIEGVGMPADTYNLAARLCRKYQIKLDPGEYITKELERIYRLVKSKSRFEHLLRDAGEKSVVIEDFLKQLEDGISVKL